MNHVDRRTFLKLSGTGLIGLTLGGIALKANAQELTHVDPNDPTAKSLQYVEESKVEGSQCANCAHAQASETEWLPCNIFPGKAVHANGWCVAHAPKA